MKKRNIVIGLILLFGFLSAQQRVVNFTEFTLENGLHVIIHKDNTTPIVALAVMYHVGAKNENVQRTGFTHFFEHLMFEGSKNIGRGEYFKIVEANGGQLNANTSNDRTFYYEILPSHQLELGLWLESERMLHLKIDSIGVETQRSVVKEEIKQTQDNQPYGSVLKETLKRSFKKYPYKWTTLGDAQHINDATIEEFRDFYKTFYVPNNATLVLAGDLEIDDAKSLIEKYFGEIPKGSKPIYRPNANAVRQRFQKDKIEEKAEVNFPDIVEPEQTAEIRDVVRDNITLPAVIMAYRSPAQGTQDYYSLKMLASILSVGSSSRLNKEIVDKQQKAVYAGSIQLPFEDPGLVLNVAIANQGIAAEEIEKAISAEIEKVKKDLISEKEFLKLRNQIENQFVNSNSTMQGIAGSLANYHVFYGDANLINTEIDRFLSVTREDIRNVANKYFNEKNRVVLYYLPKEQNKQ